MATVVDSTTLIVLLVILSAVLAVLLLGLIVLAIVLVVRCRRMRAADEKHVPAQQPQPPYAYATAGSPQVAHQPQPQPQPLPNRPPVALKPPKAIGDKAPPPNVPRNKYVPEVKAGLESGPGASSSSGPSGPSDASGISGSALRRKLNIKSSEYSDGGTLAFGGGPQSGPSGPQHMYSGGETTDGATEFAWKQSGSSPNANASGPNASGSANYSGPAGAPVPLHEYTVPGNDYGTAYEHVGTAAGQETEAEAGSYEPTYDKLHAYHPKPNPDAATVNENENI